MKYWIVIHDRTAYLEEPKYIGKETRLKGKINKIKKDDKVLYYSRGESVIINSYDVTTQGKELEFPDDLNRIAWQGLLWCYRIKKRFKSDPNVPISEICRETKLKIFPNGKVKGILLRGRTAIEISASDFKKIEKFMKAYNPKPGRLFQGRANEGNLGEPIDLEILNYAPTSEQGVVVLFAAFMKQGRVPILVEIF